MNTSIAPFKALHVGTQNTTAKEPQRTQMWHTTGINIRLTFTDPYGVSHLYLLCVFVILLLYSHAHMYISQLRKCTYGKTLAQH